MIFFTPVIVKYLEKNLDITKPHYSEHILPVPWPFIISGFHCMAWTLAMFLYRDPFNKTIKITGMLLVIFDQFIKINIIEVSNSSIFNHPIPFIGHTLLDPTGQLFLFLGIFATPPSPLFSELHLAMIFLSCKKVYYYYYCEVRENLVTKF